MLKKLVCDDKINDRSRIVAIIIIYIMDWNRHIGIYIVYKEVQL